MSYRTHPIHLVAGRPCLDFLNTANWNADGSVAVERLTDTDDLAAWCKAAGFQGVSTPSDGEGVQEALTLRNALRSIVVSCVRGGPLEKADLGILNAALESGAVSPSLSPQARGGLVYAEKTPINTILAISAATLLTDANETGRVKMCPGEKCGWHFVDESRNGRRQWCSMELCGNRAKAKRFYQRHTKPA